MKGLFVQTYGCQMNVSDSDRMKALLSPLGYESIASPAQADLLLINTCSIREKAEHKMESFAHEIKSLKKTRPGLRIGITGCVAQQEKARILEELPFVDLIIGPDNIDELPWILEELEASEIRKSIVRTDFEDQNERVWHTESLVLNPGATAFISVMKGCDHYCSYCIVPYTRGREKSRPIAEILRDLRRFVDQGVKEVTFLGQNINTFGKRCGESLEELFHRAHEILGLERIRFTTSHPGDLKDELIECFRDLPKLCSSFHLPVQSGSNRVLRDMRRFYTREQYLEKVRKLRQVRPDIAFSTDIIVAFPGETEEDFQATVDLAREIRYDNAYSFIYSQRPGTSASKRENTLPEAEKLRRLTLLQIELRKSSRELHEAQVGQIQEILVEGPSRKDASKLTGRTSQNVPVHIENDGRAHVGDLRWVEIKAATLTHLKGEVVVQAYENQMTL